MVNYFVGVNSVVPRLGSIGGGTRITISGRGIKYTVLVATINTLPGKKIGIESLANE